MSADILFEIKAKADKYEAELAKLPGYTDAAAKKSRESLEKGLYQAAAKQAAGLAKANETAAGAVVKSWSEVGKKVGELSGGPFAKLSSAIFDLVPKAGAAGEALGGIALAGGAVAGVAIGVVAVGAAVAGIANAAADAEKHLREAGRAAEIPRGASVSLAEYRQATEALQLAWDKLLVTIGPQVALVAADFIGLMAQATGATTSFAESARNAADKGTYYLLEGLEYVEDKIASLVGAQDARLHPSLKLLTEAFATLGTSIPLRIMERYRLAANNAARADDDLAELAEKYAGLNAQIAEVTKQKEEEAKAEKAAAEAAKKAAAEKEAQARREAETAKRLAEAKIREEERADAATRALLVKRNQEVLDWQAAQVAGLKAWADANIATLETVGASWDGYDAQVQGIQDRIEAAAKAYAEQQIDQAQEAFDITTSLATTATDVISGLIETRTKKGKKAAQVAAGFEKGIALTGVGVQTALAVIKAFALFGPPPSPGGVLSAAAAVAAGASAANDIRKQAAPSFFAGGVIPGAPGQPVQITAHGREPILTGEGALARLGQTIVDAVNGGTLATRALGAQLAPQGGGGSMLRVELDAGSLGKLRGRGRTGYRGP